MDIVNELLEHQKKAEKIAEVCNGRAGDAFARAAAEIESLRADNKRKDKQLEKSEHEYLLMAAELEQLKQFRHELQGANTRLVNERRERDSRIAALEAAIETHREQRYGTCKRPAYLNVDETLYTALKTEG